MALTITEATTIVQRSLGDDPDVLSIVQVINTAGTLLAGMRKWKWLQRTSYSLGVTASQAYINLPSDLKSIQSIVSQENWESARWVNAAQLERWRRGDMGVPPNGYVMLLAGGVAGDNTAIHRLEIYPTPSADASDVFSMSYTAGWSPITSGTAASTNLTLPTYLEPLFYELLTAVAKSFDEEDSAGLTARINMIKSGAVYMQAVEHDGSTQPIISGIPGIFTDVADGNTLADPEVV